ncbi:MAG: sugar transferase [Bacteroidota bacterium]
MAIGMWRNFRLVIIDSMIFFIGFIFTIFINSSTSISDLLSMYFVIQFVLWLSVSALFMKYSSSQRSGITRMAWILILCNSVILAVGTYGIKIIIPDQHPANRFFLYAVFFITLLEFLFYSFFQSYLSLRKTSLWETDEGVIAANDAGWPVSDIYTKPTEEDVSIISSRPMITSEMRSLIIQEIGESVYKRLAGYLEFYINPLLVVSTTTTFNIQSQPMPSYGTIVNFAHINGIRYLNKFFETVNAKLQVKGLFLGRAEVYSTRKRRILRYYPFGINYLVYSFDYLLNRVFPKLPFTKQIYFFITKGSERVLSRTETLGRLYSCGYEIVEEIEIDDLLYFVGRKIRKPYFDNNPTYGVLIKLNRVGKDGRIIGIYKLRTMHPYSEYLQPYIYTMNKLREGGKIRDDFRVTTIGGLARRFWIDELPMVINLLKGEVKLVGVRPLSKHFFELYSPELREKRIKYRPGLIPPYYADMPKTLEEVMDSEMRYLEAYEKNPIRTDFYYFRKALYQIIIKQARSH